MKESESAKFISQASDRELLRKRAEKLARSVSAASLEEEAESKGRDHVIFSMGGDVYAFETMLVKEVLEPEEIVSVPCTPDFLRGVVTVRGHIWAVIDLCSFLKVGTIVNSARPKVLLLSSGEKEFGVAVDEVLDVLPVSRNELKPLSEGQDAVSRYSLGITEDRKNILDGNLLLREPLLVVNEFVGSI
ncbi:chemotaxis protein CheW [Maridesulfovibrio hydrothermalis]|nr:chemotaxis protein CheW [Maridesulfovibrio hydrothermalis]